MAKTGVFRQKSATTTTRLHNSIVLLAEVLANVPVAKMAGEPMSKPNLLVVCPPDHYALRNLAQIGDLASISISNNEAEIEKLAKDADVILYTSLTGKTVGCT
jgi:hypothetical protein